jgi:hypothetical protein
MCFLPRRASSAYFTKGRGEDLNDQHVAEALSRMREACLLGVFAASRVGSPTVSRWPSANVRLMDLRLVRLVGAISEAESA